MPDKKFFFPTLLLVSFSLGNAISAWAQTSAVSSSADSAACNKPPPPPSSPNLVQTLESFGNEYEWINVKRCKRPSAKAPPRIWIDVPKNMKSKEKKISIRRWADRDGDGICELYDVGETWKGEEGDKDSNGQVDKDSNGQVDKDSNGQVDEDSNGQMDEDSTGQMDVDPVYPMRTMKFENGKWHVPEDWSDIWVPMILRDKVSGARIEVQYKVGRAGSGQTPMSFNTQFRGNCEAMRLKLAVGYMLYFHFPRFAKNDVAMNPQGGWNDYGGGFFWSEYWEMSDNRLDDLPDDCHEKYRLVIDALKTKGEFSK